MLQYLLILVYVTMGYGYIKVFREINKVKKIIKAENTIQSSRQSQQSLLLLGP